MATTDGDDQSKWISFCEKCKEMSWDPNEIDFDNKPEVEKFFKDIGVGSVAQVHMTDYIKGSRNKKFGEVLKAFDLQHILSIKPTNCQWIDHSHNMEFTGRLGFREAVLNQLRTLTPHSSPQDGKLPAALPGTDVGAGVMIDGSAVGGSLPLNGAVDPTRLQWQSTPATLMQGPKSRKETTALVYSSVSGSGKTIAMLHLKKTLPKDVNNANVAVAYLGFNSGLELDFEESEWIKKDPTNGPDQVLARRLVASTIISLNNPTEITTLPRCVDVYKGYEIPTVETSKEILLDYIRQHVKNKSLYIVAGVDEVQLLNSIDFPGLSIGLGRHFLRSLREWQFSWAEAHIRLVPLGTGIAVDWTTNRTYGRNVSISGGDAVLISKEHFHELAWNVLENMCQEEFASRFSEESSKETACDIITAAFWPRVRLLEWWRDGIDIGTNAYDVRCEMWHEWLSLWMLGKSFDVSESTLVPGRGAVNGRIEALFELRDDVHVSVIPDSWNAHSLLMNLIKEVPLKKVYNRLATLFEHFDPSAMMPKDEYCFEDMGFDVVSAAIRTGMHTMIANSYSLDNSVEQKKRLFLARWFWENGAHGNHVPRILGKLESTGHYPPYYPFEKPIQDSFSANVQEALREAVENFTPLYIRCGKNACCDYLYFYVTEEKQLICSIFDAKYTNQEVDATISKGDQIKLFKAALKVKTALCNMELDLMKSVRLLFVTNKSRMPESDSADLRTAKEKARRIWKDLELELLNKSTFDFGPFSDMLMVRRQRGQSNKRKHDSE